MSSLTATVVLGNRHSFDGDINPLHQIEVYEGSTIAFQIRSYDDVEPTRTWLGIYPERARETLFAVMTLLLPDFEQHPLANATTVDSEAIDESDLRELAAVAASTWSFAVDATLRDGSILRTEDFAHLAAASVIVFTPTYIRQPIHSTEGDHS